MADNQVELKVKSDLRKILQDLEGLQKKASGVAQQVQRVGSELDKNLQNNAKKTEQHFERMRDLGRRLADQLRGYFANIANSMAGALENVKKDLGLKQQFKDAALGAVELHDVIRKLSASLGIAGERVVGFQQKAVAAFNSVGLGTEEAGRAFAGIAKTQVEGEENIIGYGTTASLLAQAGGQQGQEGEIAKAITELIRERGGNVNDMQQAREAANAARGQDPLGRLQSMTEMYHSMPEAQRRTMAPADLRGVQAVAKTAGSEVYAAFKALTADKLKTLAPEAQGLGGLFGKGGVDFEKLDRFSHVMTRIPFDKVASVMTTGLDEEAARGIVRMTEMRQAAKSAQERAMAGREGSLQDEAERSRGFGENFGAVKNRVTGAIGNVLTPAVGVASDVMGQASKSTLGSAALMGGGFLAASAGAFGLSKLAGRLGPKMGGAADFAGAIGKGAAIEQITGEKTTPVYVVNVGEFRSAFAGATSGMTKELGAMSKGMSLLNKASMITTAAMTGAELGSLANDWIEGNTKGTIEEADFEGNAIERFFFRAAEKLGRMTGGNEASKAVDRKLARDNNELKRDTSIKFNRHKLDSKTSSKRTGAAAATPNTDD